ncbi:ABC transporter substrate-binding protein [Fimbriimonas ginsengisoli]|uniref:Putative sugar-binding lipoprotein n=1 Tax=Fimbriimonas ginsengisoli Gsoil 348 TaxID=661478 RepID=A0A068NMT1_FIMGI|nr:sugar ABC transporter substrate-binding protein [Fimbriimonas ginsengisoli]AIE84702.1 putative sugar-binding lipoprotein [Fimbriimonas ginsengisoli Gsoil 348]
MTVRLAIAILAGLTVVGCRTNAGCPPDKACLRYMAWGNPEQLAAEQNVVDKFNRQNPDLFVSLFTVPSSSYQQKAVLMLASRTAPDVMRIDHYNYPMMQPKGYFRDLTDFAKNDPTFHESDYFPTAIAECKIGNRLYGLSTLYGGIILYYNKTLMRQAGLEDPYEVYKRGDWTWNRMREYAKKLTHFENGRAKTFGLNVPSFPANAVAIWNMGGDFLSPDMKHCVVDSEGTVRGYQFLADLIWKDHVAPSPSQAANSAFAFESGKVGMTFDFMGMVPSYRQKAKDFEWDVCPPPRGDGPLVDVVKGNQLIMSANCPNPKAAWRFMRFYTGVEAETELYAKIRRCFPTRIAVAKSPIYLDGSLPPAHPIAFVQAAEAGRILPINSRWGEWTQLLNAETDNLMAGRERDARAVLRRAKEKIDAVLAEDPGY